MKETPIIDTMSSFDRSTFLTKFLGNTFVIHLDYVLEVACFSREIQTEE